jgi:hypothetical protein
MSRTFHATFDGHVLHLEGALMLPPNTRVVVTIETIEEAARESHSFLRTARSLNLEGPPDWASRLDDYLHGEKAHLDE